MNRVFFSNRLEELADCLSDALFTGSTDPFAQKMVIVPSGRCKEFLTQRWARDPKLGIAAGVRICTLVQAFQSRGENMASSLDLGLALEGMLVNLAAGDPVFEPLIAYLGGSAERRAALCKQLGELFYQYGIYGGAQLSQWEKQTGWQQALWKDLRARYSYPLQLAAEDGCWDVQIHIYGLAALPEPYLSFFQKQGASFYLFSPCSMFWGDLRTDAERLRSPISAELDAYLSDRHPLLANMGQQGRPLMELAEREDFICEERYLAPGRSSVLHAFQSDLLEQRTPELNLFNVEDRSIRVLSAPSKLREVEGLKEELWELWKRDPTLLPGDISVFAPDISIYVPYIHMVFDGSGVEYAIYDLPAHTDSPLAQAFCQLLALTSSRWKRESLLQLFSQEPFASKQGWSGQDVGKICTWVERGGIKWGFDGEHRSRFLDIAEERGSWSFGFATLLRELVLLPEKDGLQRQYLEMQDAELLGNLVALVEDLAKRLLHLDGLKTAEQWYRWLHDLLEHYFSYASNDMLFWNDLKNLLMNQTETFFPFSAVYRVIQELMDQRRGSFNANQLQAIQFASLLPGCARPARLICLLGMDEGAFPREEAVHALASEEMHRSLPARSDVDRYLFLELLMAAREYFFLSYVSVSAEDHHEQSPSLVVQELLSVLDQSYSGRSKELPSQLLRTDRHIISATELKRAICPPAIPSLGSFPSSPIAISSLTKLARHPIEFYCQEVLELFFSSEEREEEITLDPKLRGQIRQKSLKRSLGDILLEAERYALLPEGAFKDVAQVKVEDEIEQMQGNLRKMGIDPRELFSIEFTTGCSGLEQRYLGTYFAPPLSIPLPSGATVLLVGKIDHLAPQGVVLHRKDDMADLVRSWPLWLIAHQIPLIRPRLILTKEGIMKESLFDDPLAALQDYLAYFALCRRQISPLLPEWSKALLQGEAPDLELVWEKGRFPDPYLDWFLRRHPQEEASHWFAAWSETLCKIFKP